MMIKLTSSLFGQMIGWSIVLVLLFATNSQATSYEKTVFDQQVTIGDFTGDSASFTAVIEGDSKDGQIIEKGEFTEDSVSSSPLDLQLEGEHKLYYPVGLRVSESTYMLVTYNQPPGEIKGETHIFRFEDDVVKQHIILPGDLNQSARVFYLDNEVYFGFQKFNTYVIAHYDLDTDELTEIFDLKVHLEVENYVFTQDVEVYGNWIYLSGGYLTWEGNVWRDKTYLLELTPHGNETGTLDIEQYQSSSGFNVLAIGPVRGGIWRASIHGTYPDHYFQLDFIQPSPITSFGDPGRYEIKGLTVHDMQVLSKSEFIVNVEGNQLCHLSIEDSALSQQWCMQANNAQFISFKTHNRHVATTLVDWEDNVYFYLFAADNPPQELKVGTDSAILLSKEDSTLEVTFPGNLVLVTLLLLIPLRITIQKNFK
ncbi:MAG: hypothetical protein ACXAD7_21645 [Candidatus Kariarchaeaceae archaeon]|jgi:hypothetical protein